MAWSYPRAAARDGWSGPGPRARAPSPGGRRRRDEFVTGLRAGPRSCARRQLEHAIGPAGRSDRGYPWPKLFGHAQDPERAVEEERIDREAHEEHGDRS